MWLWFILYAHLPLILGWQRCVVTAPIHHTAAVLRIFEKDLHWNAQRRKIQLNKIRHTKISPNLQVYNLLLLISSTPKAVDPYWSQAVSEVHARVDSGRRTNLREVYWYGIWCCTSKWTWTNVCRVSGLIRQLYQYGVAMHSYGIVQKSLVLGPIHIRIEGMPVCIA